MEELGRLGCQHSAAIADIPGLVQAQGLPDPVSIADLAAWDPVWALQVLPAVEVVMASAINPLAQLVAAQLAEPLDGIAGPWLLHALVPGMLRGQPKPALERRAALIAQALEVQLLRSRRRAWRRRQPACAQPTAIVQLFLRDAERIWLSVSPARALAVGGSWPSGLPAGLAPVADDPVAPSSAFRKLDEALACMNRFPRPGESAVDLGACPGGWSRVMLRHGATVLAVDRSPLAPHLMNAPGMTWQVGDAFNFKPEVPVDWLVADVAAYPERVAELLQIWCGGGLARNLVVQMKFKGDTDWQALDAALAAASGHGYAVRARHFFNDKNEVTLMAVAPPAAPSAQESS